MNTESPHRFAVLIAAYNAASTIEPVLERAKSHSPDVIVVVDDGSADGTQCIANEHADVVLRHQTNLGKGAALITGLGYLQRHGYEAAITLDADGQHSVDSVTDLLARFIEIDCELVLGRRPFALGKMPLLRLLANRLSSFWVSVVCKTKIRDSQCGLRLYKLSAIRLDELTTHGFDTETEILLKTCLCGGRIEQVPTPLIYKPDGQSHFRQLRDTLAIARVIIRCLFGKR